MMCRELLIGDSFASTVIENAMLRDSMKICVTGGGGFLGRYIVEQLIEQGHNVRVFSRGTYPELEAMGVELSRGDISDELSVMNALAGVDAVFHVAAIPGIWGKWETYHSINTLGTENVLAACSKHEIGKLIYTSSPSVVYDGEEHFNADESLPYPHSYLCHYPHSKALAEKAVLAANGDKLATVALRPHLIWGPRDNHLIPRLIDRAMSGKLMRVGDGNNVVSMAYVENAAKAHVQAFEALEVGSRCAGEAYFINEPEPVSLWNWVDEILALADLPPVKKSVSSGFAKFAGRGLESIYSLCGWQSEPRMTRFLASQLSQSHSYSIEKAKRDFGYAPAVSYEEGMQRLKPEVLEYVAKRKQH
jgi:2-alkyl-3-oxoalkanoate reductase